LGEDGLAVASEAAWCRGERAWRGGGPRSDGEPPQSGKPVGVVSVW